MINLTTAFNPGDVDSGKSYTHVKIVEFRAHIEKKQITIISQLGYLDGGEWIAGLIEPKIFVVSNGKVVQAYTDLVVGSTALQTDVADPGPPPVSEYNVYAAAGRNLYQWLVDTGKYVGTVE